MRRLGSIARPRRRTIRRERGGVFFLFQQQTLGDVDQLERLEDRPDIKQRVDEQGNTFDCDTDDSAYSTFELENGVIAHFNSSWCTRVRRDDLLTMHVDGTADRRDMHPGVARTDLTGERLDNGKFSIRRLRIKDKHGKSRTAYNAKVNIYRDTAQPILLGIEDRKLAELRQTA